MVTSNVDAVYDGHVCNHVRFDGHGVVNFIFSVAIRASPFSKSRREIARLRTLVLHAEVVGFPWSVFWSGFGADFVCACSGQSTRCF